MERVYGNAVMKILDKIKDILCAQIHFSYSCANVSPD